jgi:hypothetical protein
MACAHFCEKDPAVAHFVLDVRAEILLDEDHLGRARLRRHEPARLTIRLALAPQPTAAAAKRCAKCRKSFGRWAAKSTLHEFSVKPACAAHDC